MAPKQTQRTTPRFGQGEDTKHSFTFKLPTLAKKAAIYPFGQHSSDDTGDRTVIDIETDINVNTNINDSSESNSNPSIVNGTYVSFVDLDSLSIKSSSAVYNSAVVGSDSINNSIHSNSFMLSEQPREPVANMVASIHSSPSRPAETNDRADASTLPKPLPPTLPSRRPFKASCTHPIMTRVYGVHHRCDSCGRYPPFGWLYRCTQDREELLRQMIHVGSDVWFITDVLTSIAKAKALQQATFDDIGKELISLVKPRPRGPESRADTIGSFFNEITREQLQSYRPDQIATILKQRENVKVVIQQEAAKKQIEAEEQLSIFNATRESQHGAGRQSSSPDPKSNSNEARWQELERERPWVPRPEMECAYKVCPQCRPSGADRIPMSLNAIVNGDIPATVATGFGFHQFGQRPVCDVSVVARLGLPRPQASALTDHGRHVTHPIMQQPAPLAQTLGEYSMANLDDLMARHEQQFREWQQSRQQRCHEAQLSVAVNSASQPPNDKGHLPRSPGSPDLNHVAEMKEEQGRLSHAVTSLTTDMEVREMKRGEFEAAPLKVDDGIAVLEESVELHVPDVVTQI